MVPSLLPHPDGRPTYRLRKYTRFNLMRTMWELCENNKEEAGLFSDIFFRRLQAHSDIYLEGAAYKTAASAASASGATPPLEAFEA